MTYLSWDESRTCVLGMAWRLAGLKPGHLAAALRMGMENIE